MPDLFYLLDSRSNVGSRAMFWKLGGGYTSNLDEAEQFTRESAVRQYECRDTDLPWPVDYVRARAQVGVDHQYLDEADAASAPNPDGRFYVSYPRGWDGNDLVWLSGDGTQSSNLDDAIHPGKSDAALYLSRGFSVWPCGYIIMRSRAVVRAAQLNHKQALRAVGLKLPKIKRQSIRSYSNLVNCEGCGRFLNDRQRFDDCPNCDARNAP